jgi:hypothetical protein
MVAPEPTERVGQNGAAAAPAMKALAKDQFMTESTCISDPLRSHRRGGPALQHVFLPLANRNRRSSSNRYGPLVLGHLGRGLYTIRAEVVFLKL